VPRRDRLPPSSPLTRREVAATGLATIGLLAWEVSGLDRAAAHLFGDAAGFAARDAWWASTLLHEGGRASAWLLMAVLVMAAACAPLQPPPGLPSRRERWLWLAVTLASLLLVPAIKRWSSTSCPWDLAEFGGTAAWVSHWHWGVADGGAGRCFPSGHAVAAFAFLSQYFLWRQHDARRARGWLVVVLATGALFGLAQLARGAHYPSHTMWSAALCWGLGLGTVALRGRRPQAGIDATA
jgi:membrane-associated PAP2 superfamily phosphatase